MEKWFLTFRFWKIVTNFLLINHNWVDTNFNLNFCCKAATKLCSKEWIRKSRKRTIQNKGDGTTWLTSSSELFTAAWWALRKLVFFISFLCHLCHSAIVFPILFFFLVSVRRFVPALVVTVMICFSGLRYYFIFALKFHSVFNFLLLSFFLSSGEFKAKIDEKQRKSELKERNATQCKLNHSHSPLRLLFFFFLLFYISECIANCCTVSICVFRFRFLLPWK